MQTFVPYKSFIKSAVVLDNKRLNKQLLEGRQIYSILANNRTKGGWINHPAVKMWRNYDNALFEYLVAIKYECDDRGISTEKNWEAIQEMYDWNWDRGDSVVMPQWWGDERVHQSHRNNLYRKDPEYYVEFINDKRVTCCDRCNYFWPTHTLMYNLELV
jgi:hypothetical protein